MSAPSLTVDRLRATVHEAPAQHRLDQLPGTLRTYAASELERAWAGVRLPAGLWCLRRLDIAVRLDVRGGSVAPNPVRAWADAVAAAVNDAVTAPDPDVVHFRHELDAITDVVAELAAGRRDREWAWHQVGVWRPDDPTEPGAAVLAVLGRSPEHIVPALVRALPRCGFPALDRMVGSVGWPVLADAVWPATAGDIGRDERRVDIGLPADHRDLDRTGARPADVFGRTCGPGPGRVPADGYRRAARAVLAGSELAAAIGRARPRPTPTVLAAWAVLVVVHTDPARSRRAADPALVDAVATELSPRGRATPRPRPGAAAPNRLGARPAPRAEGTAGGSSPPQLPPVMGRTPVDGDRTDRDRVDQDPIDRDRTGRHRTRDDRIADGLADRDHHHAERDRAEPDRTDRNVTERESGGRDPGSGPGPADRRDDCLAAPLATVPGAPTDWAGLPFLLATAAEVGMPDVAATDPDLADRPLAWVLVAIGRAVAPVPDGDAALLALAGLDPDRAGRLRRAAAATPAEQAAVDRLARIWVAVTAARLATAGGLVVDPGTSLVAMARRPGRVFAEPGWVEVHLPLDRVDPVVRRAGLDLDPGWTSWLGAVVRYVYE